MELNVELFFLPNNKIRLKLTIDLVNSSELRDDQNHYKILLNKRLEHRKHKDHQIIAKLLINKNLFNELKNTGDRFIQNKIKIEKNKNNTYSLKYESEVEFKQLLHNQNCVIISITDINIGIKYVIPFQLFDYIQEQQLLKRYHKNRRVKIRENRELVAKTKKNTKNNGKKKNRIKNSVDPFISSTSKIKKTESSVIQNKMPTPKIWTATDNSFKRCDHCLSFNVSGCSRHKKKVSRDNCCKDFYYPKIYLGGSVSPK
ncbi:hypothetical protein [Bacillus infantis]|uniref:hypothetical protein n=1 Tax=Bacillus infantis TaxID=324767 RepID=UPI002155E201|nr:hypothetical protein [Bacillus infantis]MCR6609453.1 hypothetical protein [Bacillus infantis]